MDGHPPGVPGLIPAPFLPGVVARGGTILIHLRKTDRPAGGAPPPISSLELDGRRAELRARYPGLKVRGESDPSNSLMEEYGRQYEADQLRHVSRAQATGRNPELPGASAAKRPSSGFEEDSMGLQ